MFSIWWILAAFLGGVYAGIFAIALMHISGDSPRQSRQRTAVGRAFASTHNRRTQRLVGTG